MVIISGKNPLTIFEKVNKVQIPFTFHDRRPGDNAFIVADNSLAKSILSWEPKYYGKKGFKLGLQKTVEWFKNKTNLSMYNSKIFNQ